jgi:hypothetical protein
MELANPTVRTRKLQVIFMKRRRNSPYAFEQNIVADWPDRLTLTTVKAALRLVAVVVFLLLFVGAGLRHFNRRRREGCKKLIARSENCGIGGFKRRKYSVFLR